MEFGDYLAIAGKHRRMIAVVVILCTGAAAFYSVRQEPVYRASVLMAVSDRGGVIDQIDGRDASSEQTFKTALLLKVGSLKLARKVARQLDYYVSPTRLTSLLTVEEESDASSAFFRRSESSSTAIIRLTVSEKSRKRAINLANIYARTFSDIMRESEEVQIKRAVDLVDKDLEAYRSQIGNLSKQINGAQLMSAARATVSTSGTVTLIPDNPQSMEIYAEWAKLVSSYGRLSQRRDELSLLEQTTSGESPIDLVWPANSAVPTKRSLFTNSLIGLLAGFAVAVGAVWVLEYADNSLKTGEELEKFFKSPVLAEISGISKQDCVPVSASPDPSLDASETYRLLCTNIKSLGKSRMMKTLLFADAQSGHSSSVVLANAAVSFSRAGYRVIVVCSNLRKPKLDRLFGFVAKNKKKGLSNWLVRGGDIKDILFDTNVERVKIMPAGTRLKEATELLDSSRMEELVSFLRSNFDLAMFDAPPVLETADVAILSQKVDGVVVVVPKGKIDPGLAGQARQRLDKVNANLLGVVAVSGLS